MSIASMADNAIARTAPAGAPARVVGAPPGPPAAGGKATAPPAPGVAQQPAPVGVPTALMSSLTRWIPTETITAYVGAQALLGNITVSPGKKLYQADFTTRWVIFAIALAITPVIVVLYTKIKQRTSKTQFRWPVFEMAVASLSFVVWAMALPNTPFNDFKAWESWWGGAAILFGTPLITLAAAALGKDPQFS